ncbi:hypothetical protein JW992_12675, partial [candidate division KSB1 bacterium]|nr:hypothetical protein [candidate division KSB1 bacterium]
MKIPMSILLMVALASADPEIRISGSNRDYQPEDWITFCSTRFVRNVSVGREYVYYCTSGGLCRYNFYSNQWDFPYTVSNGLADNDVYIAALDVNTGYLWVVTQQAISYLDPASRYWTNTYLDELGLFSERITAIGFSADRKVYAATSGQKILVSDGFSSFFSSAYPPGNLDEVIWYGERARNSSEIPA